MLEPGEELKHVMLNKPQITQGTTGRKVVYALYNYKYSIVKS